jgi:hypothetical protein
VKDIAQNHNPTPKKLDINGKVIPSRTCHKGTQDSKKKWGGFIKTKGCRVEFTINTLYLFKHVLKLCFIQQNHVKQDGLHVHGHYKMGDRSAFAAHLSEHIKDFVMEQLRLRLAMSQIMAKHRQHVKNIMLMTCELNRDMLLIEQDVRVLFGKWVQETY